MAETNEKQHSGFSGTYFEPSSILSFSRLTNVLAWIVLSFHLWQIITSVTVFLLQVIRGLMVLSGVTDYVQQFIWLFAPIVPGALYFVGIQAIGKALLILMDIEDNTRRAARK